MMSCSVRASILRQDFSKVRTEAYFTDFRRHTDAFRKHEAAPYDGGPLCPCGYRYPETVAVMPGYSYTFGVNFAMLREKGGRIAFAACLRLLQKRRYAAAGERDIKRGYA